jgi:hypothetical protein
MDSPPMFLDRFQAATEARSDFLSTKAVDRGKRQYLKLSRTHGSGLRTGPVLSNR